ncbi:MAG: hydroxymethylpyrimidine/phosphomethylpyrimidine kinase [Pseudohongiellaceae bacterium]
MSFQRPTVMCFSGLDPTGGAGIQADIETLFSIGCHCTPVLTAVAAQNTENVIEVTYTQPSVLIQQARAVLEDIPIQCFKIGLTGNEAVVEVLHTLLRDYPDIPVVLDPVLYAGGGFNLSTEGSVDAIRTLLLPLTTVLTPNSEEMRLLSPTADTVDACANEILETGCRNVLLTGTHMNTTGVINRLYTNHQEPLLFNWPRLPHSYHGSGCTLAAGLSGYLAHGLDLHDAVQQAQRFTWEALSHGTRIGMGQHIPNRSYWNRQPQ